MTDVHPPWCSSEEVTRRQHILSLAFFLLGTSSLTRLGNTATPFACMRSSAVKIMNPLLGDTAVRDKSTSRLVSCRVCEKHGRLCCTPPASVRLGVGVSPALSTTQGHGTLRGQADFTARS
jgi:hypothetical protein